MRRSRTGLPDQRMMYRYIGLAFEATRHLSVERLDGNAEEFLTRLYLRRMGSVFGEPVDSPGRAPRDLTNVSERLGDMHHRKADGILLGRIRQFDFNDPGLGGGQTESRPRAYSMERFRREDELGIETYAAYFPIHFFPVNGWLESKWGIYISEAGVKYVAEILKTGFVDRLGRPQGDSEVTFLRIAFEVLLRHEMEHFKIESFALNAELQHRKAIYVPYLLEVYAKTYQTNYCLEESLANATVLDSTVIKKLVQSLYPTENRTALVNVIAKCLFDSQPPGYSNYALKEPWHQESERTRLREVELTNSPRRDAMNYLCNQILTGKVRSDKDLFPFYAFPPDNYFLRADSLVPIYILKDISERDSFISFPTPTRKAWERLLKKIGFHNTGGSGDHEVWKRRGFHMITNNYYGKNLDPKSFKSALHSLGITRQEFNMYCSNDKIPERLLAKLHDLDHQLVLT